MNDAVSALGFFRGKSSGYVNNPKIANESACSSKQNTVIFMSVSSFNDTKKQIIRSLLQNKYYEVVFGVDNKYKSSISEIKNNSDATLIVELNYGSLVNEFGTKINNFNGKFEKNPAKLGAYAWFKDSKFSFMWYIEDDVFSKDWNEFLEPYADTNHDLIYNFEDKLPAWYFDNWKVGDKKHGIQLAHLYVHRISKYFVNSLIKTIKEEKSTSHHEIFIPYVKFNSKSSFIQLISKHTQYACTNGDDKTNLGYSKEFIEKTDSNLFHPVKFL
tara:strand:- start:709 stop:1524 length:816 start_codon:yes stop_codon:yes gene_type:complete